MGNFLLTIDIGGTRVKSAVWNGPFAEHREPFLTSELARNLQDFGESLLARISCDLGQLSGVAVSIAGPVNMEQNRIVESYSISELMASPHDRRRLSGSDAHGLSAAEFFPSLTTRQIPVFLVNDAVAAVASCVYSGGHNAHPLVCLSLGTFGGVGYSDGSRLYPTEHLGRLKVGVAQGPKRIADIFHKEEVARLNPTRLLGRIQRSADAIKGFLSGKGLPVPKEIFILGGNSRRLQGTAMPNGFTLCHSPEQVPQHGLKFLWEHRHRLMELIDPTTLG